MAKSGLKQKVKRAAAQPSHEKPHADQIPSDNDVDMGETSDDESVPEKGEDEKKLERMLFGDDDGFMGGLKAQQQRADGMQLTLLDGESEGEGAADDDEDNEDLEDMADEDVRCCQLLKHILYGFN